MSKITLAYFEISDIIPLAPGGAGFGSDYMTKQNLSEQQKLESRRLHPVNPLLYGFLGRVVVQGALVKKYNAHFTYKDDVSAYRGKSYVVVSNHASRMDYVFTAPAFLPDSFNFVVGYNEFFRSHLAAILRMAQVIPKKNFVHQPYAIRQIIKVIRSGGRIILLPEGMSSISGANQPCALGSGHLLKSLGVPVLYTKIAGGYLTAPKYNLTDRIGRVDVEAGVLFTPEQLKSMSAEEVQRALDEKLYHDDYEWNKTARVKFDGAGRMAENMHQLLFWCPRCGAMLSMESGGDTIRCKNCGNSGHLNEYYDLIPDGDSVLPETPRVWFDMQREHVRSLVRQPGYTLSERVQIGRLPERGYLKGQATSEICGEGTLTLDAGGLRYSGTRCGGEWSFFVPIKQLPTYGMCTDVSRFYTFVDGEFTEFYPSGDTAELWFMATEEMHRAQGGLWRDFEWKTRGD